MFVKNQIERNERRRNFYHNLPNILITNLCIKITQHTLSPALLILCERAAFNVKVHNGVFKGTYFYARININHKLTQKKITLSVSQLLKSYPF